MDKRTLRQRLQERHTALKTERTSWDTHWREITEYLLPWSGRYYTSDRNKGNKRQTRSSTEQHGDARAANAQLRPDGRCRLRLPDRGSDSPRLTRTSTTTIRSSCGLRMSNSE
jgi:hypothetical protein